VRGALYVTLTTDRTERVATGSRLYDGQQWLVVESARVQPGNKYVVRFEGLDDRDAAERLTGRILSAEPIEDDGELWVHDLIGSRVVDAGGVDRGECISVIDNPAHDILELDTGHLVPATFIVSASAGVITVDVPDGLFDLLE
jgi:16S rRNA processing protein RimM